MVISLLRVFSIAVILIIQHFGSESFDDFSKFSSIGVEIMNSNTAKYFRSSY